MGRSPLAVGLVALLTAPALAQAPAASGDGRTLGLAAGGVVPVGEAFGPSWSAGPGAQATVEAPLSGGVARASLVVVGFEAARPDLPGFSLAVPTVGWGPRLTTGPLRWTAGAEVGIARFGFEEVDGAEGTSAFGGNLQTETEVVIGAWARLEVGVAGPVWVWAEGGTRRIALAEAATLTSASAGLGVRFEAPAWVRAALR